MEVRCGALRSDTFPNFRFRVVVGVDGGHGARLAERLFKLSNKGGWRGRWWLTRAERTDLNLGVVVGGDGGIECGWSAGGGKAPAAYRGTG